MGRKRKKQLSPRRKRMKRAGRLQSAVSWLKQFTGKNVLRGYCRHFGVDWRCAAIELQQLGVRLDPNYLEQRALTGRKLVERRKQRREASKHRSESWYNYDSPLEAYLAEDYAALHDIECKANSHGG
jgi:hypothetical protein